MYYSAIFALLAVALALLLQYEHVSDPVFAQQTVVLDSDLSTVFKQILRLDTFPILFPFCEEIIPENDTPWGVGKSFKMVQTLPLLGDLNSTAQIDKYEINKEIEISYDDTSIWLPIMSVTFKEDSVDALEVPARPKIERKTTAINIQIQTKRRSLLVQWLVRPIVHFPIQSHLRHRLFALKYMFQSNK